MIEVSGLSKRYGTVDAIKDVSFSVSKGQIVGFLGANGAGKTTTMDIMCGCIGADEGSVKIGPFDITDDPIEAKRKLGYLPDSAPLHMEMTVLDYIKYSAKVRGVSRADLSRRLEYTIDQLSLGDVRKRLIGNLSKGFRQRVAFAQAIVHDPDVLVLDEPTEGLDPNQIAHIRDLIKSLSGQHTIILSSHILSEVQNTVDRIIIIHRGRIVQQGTYGELVSSLESTRHYQIRVAREHERLKMSLEALAGVRGVQALEGHDKVLEFHLAPEVSDDVVEDVCRTVLNGGYGLRSLAEKRHSLEEVFMKVTR